MTEETYKRLTDIKRNIAHIDDVLALCRSILDNPGYGDDKKAVIRETGFIPHPRDVSISHDDIVVIIDALTKKQESLQHEFNNT